MHPRNIFKIRPPNYEELVKKYPAIRAKCFIGAGGKVCMDFHDPEAVRLIAEVFLREYFELDVKIQPGALVPRIPQRLNYIHYIEDLIHQNNLQNGQIFGIDIGTGPSCIFPLLGVALNHWAFVGTDISEKSIREAEENIKRNSFNKSIELFLIRSTDSIFKDLFSEEKYANTNFTFSMCNPPFFDPDEADGKFLRTGEATYQNIQCDKDNRGSPLSATTAAEQEIFYKGGEVSFVQKMIDESELFPNKTRIYTSMVGKLTSLKKLKAVLQRRQIKHAEYTLSQGRTSRWIVTWTFFDNINLI